MDKTKNRHFGGYLLILVVSLAFSISVVVSPVFAGNLTLSISPAQDTWQEGDTFTAEVVVDVGDQVLADYNLDFIFNEDVLQITGNEVLNGKPDETSGITAFPSGPSYTSISAANTSGQISIEPSQASLNSPTSNVSLFQIPFKVIGVPGTSSQLTVDVHDLKNPDDDDISYSIVSATVSVFDSPGTCELTGTVKYGTDLSGATVKVMLFNDAGFQNQVSSKDAMVSETGTVQVTGLKDGTFYVAVFKDATNHGGILPAGDDPRAAAAAAVDLVADADDPGDFGTVTLMDPPILRDIPTPSINQSPSFRWNKVAGADTFDLQVSRDSAFSGFNDIDITGLTQNSYIYSGSLPDERYSWRVRPVSDGGYPGAWGHGQEFVVDAFSPSSPANLVAEPQLNGDIKLDWSNPDSDFSGALLLFSEKGVIAEAPVDGINYDDRIGDELKPGSGVYVLAASDLNTYTDKVAHDTQRFYALFAYDAVNNYSGVVRIDGTSNDQVAPGNVTDLEAIPGNEQVVVSWNNPVWPDPTDNDYAGVLVLYKQGQDAPTGLPENGTIYTDDETIGDGIIAFAGDAAFERITDLANGDIYSFKVFTYDEVPNYSTGESDQAVPTPFGIDAPELPFNVEAGDSVNFSASGSETDSYHWTFSGGSPTEADTDTVVWTAPASVTDTTNIVV
ncbi:MAG: hypothetical protein U9R20_00090, partial [Thermodesulfobacteriota bacterium]|nr:hypothetical protein [Thermodesulfobacteriota bacterium]